MNAHQRRVARRARKWGTRMWVFRDFKPDAFRIAMSDFLAAVRALTRD